MRILRVIVLVLLLCTGWSGDERLPVWSGVPLLRYRPVELGAARTGQLTYLGGVQLLSHDAAFGGYSSMLVRGDRFTLLSDGGMTLGFQLTRDMTIHAPTFGQLPDGPGTGWRKSDRDSESMVRDPATGRLWVGFEKYNAIWRYAPDFVRAEAHVMPRAMSWWADNGGPEAMIRLRDGRFLVFSETRRAKNGGIEALIFAGDPTVTTEPPQRFAFQPPPPSHPVDAVELDDGRLLILTRQLSKRKGFISRLVMLPRGTVKPGAIVSGKVIAEIADPLIHDNFEGLAVTREHGKTIVWIVSDDNNSIFEQSLLLKFRLDE